MKKCGFGPLITFTKQLATRGGLPCLPLLAPPPKSGNMVLGARKQGIYEFCELLGVKYYAGWENNPRVWLHRRARVGPHLAGQTDMRILAGRLAKSSIYICVT